MFGTYVKAVVIACLVLLVLGTAAYAMGWIGDTGQVVKDEFGPKAALAKYEWFIDQSAAIAKMDQDIKNFETRRTDVDKKYAIYGAPTSWSEATKIQYNAEAKTASEDLLAVVSQRNNLVKEYNAASEKFNWTPFQTYPDKPAVRFDAYAPK